MAFVLPEATIRLIPPPEFGFGPDEWIEIRTYYTVAMRRRVFAASAGDDPFAWRSAVVLEAVVAWSDAEPVTAAALDRISPSLQDWIAGEFDRLTAGRTDDEKKDSGSSSPATSGLEPANSLASSHT